MGYYVKWGLIGLVLAIFAAFLHYTLPQWDVVRVTDTYEKRVDAGSSSGWFWASADTGEVTSGPRDVFFIQTMRSNDKPMVYRNEDTGWGWPPFFKFDTSNLQAQASDLRSTPEAPKWVAVKHYGWRLEYLSIYPNALAVKQVMGPDARVIPWASIVMLVLILMVIWAITSRVVRFGRRRVAPAMARADQRASDFWARLRGR